MYDASALLSKRSSEEDWQGSILPPERIYANTYKVTGIAEDVVD